ncbi:MAG TPA: O-methyltransferase [Paenibacillaceae bacterium]
MAQDQVPLARQVDVAISQLEDELKRMTAGTIVLQIRDDNVGKFGLRHLPLSCEEQQAESGGLTSMQVAALRRMAVQALRRKGNWTHGEICYDFALKNGKLTLSVQFESNYNMANMLFRLKPKKRDVRESAGD